MSAKDVVKRLRGGSPYELTNKLMQEAADRIEHLERREYELMVRLADQSDVLMAKAKRAEERIERLREELEHSRRSLAFYRKVANTPAEEVKG